MTDAMQIAIPHAILPVNGSENIKVPTRIAVIGSNTPSTDVLVGPIFLLDTASARRDIIVGNIARSSIQSSSESDKDSIISTAQVNRTTKQSPRLIYSSVGFYLQSDDYSAFFLKNRLFDQMNITATTSS